MARLSAGRGRRKRCEDDDIPLPDPFPLPKHHAYDIEVALRQKKMSSTDKRKFITDVASAMLRFKYYPSHDDYLCVARCITTQYPFMKSSDSKPYVSVECIITASTVFFCLSGCIGA